MHSISSLFSLPLTDPLMVLFVILTAVFVMPWLARRLGFPEVIALIIFGIILGPNVLGVLERDRLINLFSTMGLLFLMFIAGLEIDGNDFRRHRAKSLWFGFLTFIIPMIIGTLAGIFILRFSLTTSILLASMFASHTLLAYPIAMRLKISGDTAVGAAVGGTIITDVAALLVLAVIAGLNRGEFGTAMVVQMSIGLAVFTGFELFLLPRLASAVYDKLEKEGDLQFLFTLLVLFGSGILAEMAGVEPIIGAFLAGIAVGRHIPPVSPLANRVEFFGNSMFVPAFLISVGMVVDPRAFIADRQSIVVAVVMVLCVSLAKWLAAQGAGMIFGWNQNRRKVVFGLSVVQAAATLAAVLVGYELGIFNDAVMNGTIVMIMVTVIMGSVTVQQAGSALAEESAAEADDENGNRRILMGINYGEDSDRLLDVAMLLRGPEDRLKAVTVIPIHEATTSVISDAEQLLDEARQQAVAAGLELQTTHRADASPMHGLSGAAREFLATDLVVGLRPRRSFVDRGSRKPVETFLEAIETRLVVARLGSSLATVETIPAVFLKDSQLAADFSALVQSVKAISRNSRARLSCVGAPDALALVRDVLSSEPALSTVDYLEADSRAALASSGRSNQKNLSIIVGLRPDNSEGGRASAALLHELDGRYKGQELLLLFPASGQTDGRRRPGILGRLRRRFS